MGHGRGAQPGTLLPELTRRPLHHASTHQAIEAVWRSERAKVVACVARIVHDIGVAEELAQDALLAALQTWPERGVPDNPGAWLTATAKNRALDHLRHEKMAGEKLEQVARTWKHCRPAWCPTSSTRSMRRARTRSATTCCA